MNHTIASAYTQLVNELTPLHGDGEAMSLASILFEDLLNISRTQRLAKGDKPLDSHQLALVQSAQERLLKNEPIQHIVGFTYFCDYRFKVTPDTLIPRSETEELVYLIAQKNKQAKSILDIATGTGCIPISLALMMQNTKISGWDISEEALTIAKENAQQLNAKVGFTKMDALNIESEERFDIIVSNPPYIPNADKTEMSKNVLDFEPGLALFVSDQDPLIFYRKIAEFGKTNLYKGGKLYYEIHERFGQETQSMLTNMGYKNVEIIQDLNGKDRMISAEV